MMKRINRMLFLLLVSILLSAVLMGCSGAGDGETGAETKDETATQAPATEKGTETDIETTTETTAAESVPATEKTTEVETVAKETETELETEPPLPPSEGLDYDFVEGDGAVRGLGSCTDTDIVIPAVHNGMKVTAIDDGAFQDCAALTNFTLPDGITYIGQDAFAGTAFYNDEANWTDGVLYIGRYLIDCKKDKTGEVVIREGTTFIARGAFEDCVSITSMYLPNSVTTIVEGAFSGCSNLASFSGGYGLTCIADFPFSGTAYCTDASNWIDGVLYVGGAAVACQEEKTGALVLREGTRYIAPEAFRNCAGLTSVKMPDSVTTIGEDAFYGCAGLANIELPNTLTRIEEGAFSDTAYYNDESNWTDCVLYIGTALIECKREKSDGVIVRDGTTIIADQAFAWRELTNIVIPDSVVRIGEYALFKCDKMTDMTIGSGVIDIGEFAFNRCYSLANITVSEKNPVYHSAGNCLIETASKTLLVGSNNSVIPDDGSVTTIGGLAFFRYADLTSINIPDSVTCIGYRAFDDCTALTSLTIGNGVTSMGEYAFSGCESLTGVYITDIARWCNIVFFDDLANPLIYAHNLYLNDELVTSLIIPDGVTNIGSVAFAYCSCLTSVKIPASVTNIGSLAFTGCSGLMRIMVAEDNPVYHADGNCLIETESKALLTGSDTSVIPTDGSVTRIASFAFYDCSNLTSITIPDSVTSIGSAAFSGCTGLTSITIGNGVTSIGWSAFADCTGLTSITIPDSVTSIGDGAFYECTGLTSITIPDSVTSIEFSAFEGCSGLTSITIPASVTSIGGWAFSDCTGLTSITFTGTMDQWNAISKGGSWNDDTGSYTIHCTDGNISK